MFLTYLKTYIKYQKDKRSYTNGAYITFVNIIRTFAGLQKNKLKKTNRLKLYLDKVKTTYLI
jgi:hypothetical protein